MDKIKIWAFPALVSVVCWFIVNTLKEIKQDLNLVKQDIKILLAQSNIDKTRIDNLEREVYQKTASNSSEKSPSFPVKISKEMLFVREEDIKKIVKA